MLRHSLYKKLLTLGEELSVFGSRMVEQKFIVKPHHCRCPITCISVSLLCVLFSKVWFSNVFMVGLEMFIFIQAIDHTQEMLVVVLFVHPTVLSSDVNFSSSKENVTTALQHL